MQPMPNNMGAGPSLYQGYGHSNYGVYSNNPLQGLEQNMMQVGQNRMMVQGSVKSGGQAMN